MIKALIYTLQLLLYFCMMATTRLQAIPLNEELRYQPDLEAFWTSRVHNLHWIENNQIRNVELNIQGTLRMRHLMGKKKFLPQISSFASLEHNGRASVIPEDIRYNFQRASAELAELIERLPPLETTTYAGISISPDFWQQVLIGDHYRETGYLYTTGSLNHAHAWLDNNFSTRPPHPTILKVEGKRGRLINSFQQGNEAPMIFPKKSHFKVLGKTYDPAQQIYFMHLQEVDPTMQPTTCAARD